MRAGGINVNPHSLKKNQIDNWDVEYVLLGDSFTHGACVNRPNDLGSVLRNLSKKTVLNLGYSGNGPLIEYATFREYVNFNARNVLFFYTEQGDLENLNLELKNEVLINYLSKKEFSQNLKGKQKEINSLVKLNIQKSFNAEEDLLYHQEKFKKKKNKFLKFLRLNDTKDLLKNNFSYFNLNKQLPLNEFKFIINDLNERTKLLGGNFYFVYLPGPQKHLSNSMLYQNKIYERKKIIFSFLNNQNIKSIDIDDEVFKNLKDPLTLYSTKIDHYNEKGYELVAKAVYRKTKFNRVN